MYVSGSGYMHMSAVALRSQERASRYPGAVFIGSYEQLDVGAGNQTQVPYKSSS